MHDIGKLIFDRYLKERYNEVIEHATTAGVSFVEAESHILGYDHAQIGGLVIAAWDLPARFVEAVATHHQPSVARDFPELAYIVHLANAFTLSLGLDVGGDGLMMMIDADAVTKLNLNADQIDALLSDIAEAVVAAGLGSATTPLNGLYGTEVVSTA
jgi:HD-like signal output (HDOD) protein